MTPRRYLIQGVFRTISPLSIRSGETWADSQLKKPVELRRDYPADCGKKLASNPFVVARDARGLPYLPGSALKGVLRSQAARLSSTDQNDDLAAALFGRESNDSDSGFGGLVTCYDARIDERWRRDSQIESEGLPWWSTTRLTYIDNGVAIDGATGTADDHKLFYVEAAPPGVEFRSELMIDFDRRSCGERQPRLLDMLLQALDNFNLATEDIPAQLGSHTANGWGRLEWSLHDVLVWSAGCRRGDAVNDMTLTQRGKFTDVSRAERSEKFPTPRPKGGAVTLAVELAFDGPFLVNDRHRELNQAKPEDSVDHYPRVVAGAPNGERRHRALLPASSARGAMRKQLERIIETIYSPGRGSEPTHEANAAARQVAEGLLGTTDRASSIWLTDFVSSEELPVYRQEMIATDRFTGGVSGSGKFSVDHFQSPTLHGHLAFRLPRCRSRALRLIGLAALLVRDLIEGDVRFGFGTRRGFGECRATISKVRIRPLDTSFLPEEIGDLPGLAEAISDATLDAVVASPAGGDHVSKALATLNSLLNDALAELRNPSHGA